MIFKKWFFLVFCCAFYGAYAAEEEESKVKRPYFWKVEKNGKTSHFLGTLHIPITVEELPCSQEIQYHLKNSDLVFVETDYFSEEQKEFRVLRKNMKLSKDSSEFRALRPETQEFFRSWGISENLNLYGYSSVFRGLCLDGEKSLKGFKLDDEVTSVAYANGIPVRESDDLYDYTIEEMEENLEAYNRLSGFKLQMEIYLLNQDVLQFSTQCPPKIYTDLIDSYKSHKRTTYVEQYLSRLTPEKREAWLLERERRNLQWLSRFKEAHKDYDRIFVAGGLNHFVGPSSFIDMLKDKGYAVEPVTCENRQGI